MTYESRKALEKIVRLCEQSENLNHRQLKIFDIALEGLGFVSGQREAKLLKWKAPIYAKIQARRDRVTQKQQQLKAA